MGQISESGIFKLAYGLPACILRQTDSKNPSDKNQSDFRRFSRSKVFEQSNQSPVNNACGL